MTFEPNRLAILSAGRANCGAKALRTSTGSAIAGSIFFVTSSREMPRMESVRGLGLAGRVADRGVRFRRKPNAGSAA